MSARRQNLLNIVALLGMREKKSRTPFLIQMRLERRDRGEETMSIKNFGRIWRGDRSSALGTMVAASRFVSSRRTTTDVHLPTFLAGEHDRGIRVIRRRDSPRRSSKSSRTLACNPPVRSNPPGAVRITARPLVMGRDGYFEVIEVIGGAVSRSKHSNTPY
jgi:hypothetical protein